MRQIITTLLFALITAENLPGHCQTADDCLQIENSVKTIITLETALHKDQIDPLGAFREEFHIPLARDSYDQSIITDDRPCIYLSRAVGIQPKATEANVIKVLNDWKNYGVGALTRGYLPTIHAEAKIKPLLAPMVGAQENEIAIMNHLSVNIHLLMNSFYRPKGKRNKILIEDGAFPADYWVVRSHIEMADLDPAECLVVVKPKFGKEIIDDDDVLSKIREIGDELALVFFPGAHYHSGQAFDMASIVKVAHEVGAYAGFDLAAVAGDMVLHLHDWNVDFALWTHYKYINGGLGSMGGAFIHSRIDVTKLKKCRGWWGTRVNTRFLCEQDDNPTGTVQDYAISHPNSMAMATLFTAVEIHQRAGIENVRQKSSDLTTFAYDLLSQFFGDKITFITPVDVSKRGSQCTVRIHGYTAEMHHWVRQQGVLYDFRVKQDAIRFSVIPLSVTYVDIWNFVNFLHQAWSNPELQKTNSASDAFDDYGLTKK